MIVLTGNGSGPKHEAHIAGRKNIGQLLSPNGWQKPSRRYWACDNDVFSNRDDPDWWECIGETNWLRMLDKVTEQMSDPMFVLLPDVVADWSRTIERAWQYLPELMERDLRFAVALQDGCCFREAMAIRPHTVFIGGTTHWKWLNAERITEWAHGRGLWVHIGRVNGPNGFREALRLCADSCDGTGINRFPDKMIPPIMRVLNERPVQEILF